LDSPDGNIYLLLRPIKLRLGDADRSTVCLGLGPTLRIATDRAKDLSCEDDEGLLCRSKVAVPASHRIKGAAQHFDEIDQTLVFHGELNESPCERLSSSHIPNFAPAYLANLKDHALKRAALHETLYDQNARNTHFAIVVAGCD
jgi:hypothetical protein